MKRRTSGFAPPPAKRPAAATAPAGPLLANAAGPGHLPRKTEGYILLRRPMALPEPPIRLPPEIVIAPIEAADAGAVHQLMQRAYASGFGTVPDNLLDWWESLLTDSEFDRNLALVAKTGSEVVGFCLCWTSSFVKDLVVDARWRNRGIASALLSTAIAALRSRGAEELALKVDIYNGTAQRLYRSFEFVQE